MSDSRPIDAIVLAGGVGTRLSPVLKDLPKPLAPVGKRAFLDILLAQLDATGQVKTVVLAVGYKSHLLIERYDGCGAYSFPVKFSVEERPLGTAGAIVHALSLTSSSDVLVMNGDTFVDFDLQQLMAVHVNNAATITVAAASISDAARYGLLEADPATGRVTCFTEKGKTAGPGLINAGCYLIRRSFLETIERGKMISLENEILPASLDRGVYVCVVSGKFIDIGTPESYAAAQEYLR